MEREIWKFEVFDGLINKRFGKNIKSTLSVCFVGGLNPRATKGRVIYEVWYETENASYRKVIFS